MNFSYRNEQIARVVTVGIFGIYEKVAYQYIMGQNDTRPPKPDEIGKAEAPGSSSFIPIPIPGGFLAVINL